MDLKDCRNHNAVLGSYDNYVWVTERHLEPDYTHKWYVVGKAEKPEDDVIYGTYSTHKLAYETCIHLANYND